MNDVDEQAKSIVRIRRNTLLIKETDHRSYELRSRILVRRNRPDELISGTVVLNNSYLDVEVGERVWYKPDYGSKLGKFRFNGHIILRAEYIDAAGDGDMRSVD